MIAITNDFGVYLLTEPDINAADSRATQLSDAYNIITDLIKSETCKFSFTMPLDSEYNHELQDLTPILITLNNKDYLRGFIQGEPTETADSMIFNGYNWSGVLSRLYYPSGWAIEGSLESLATTLVSPHRQYRITTGLQSFQYRQQSFYGKLGQPDTSSDAAVLSGLVVGNIGDNGEGDAAAVLSLEPKDAAWREKNEGVPVGPYTGTGVYTSHNQRAEIPASNVWLLISANEPQSSSEVNNNVPIDENVDLGAIRFGYVTLPDNTDGSPITATQRNQALTYALTNVQGYTNAALDEVGNPINTALLNHNNHFFGLFLQQTRYKGLYDEDHSIWIHSVDLIMQFADLKLVSINTDNLPDIEIERIDVTDKSHRSVLDGIIKENDLEYFCNGLAINMQIPNLNLHATGSQFGVDKRNDYTLSLGKHAIMVSDNPDYRDYGSAIAVRGPGSNRTAMLALADTDDYRFPKTLTSTDERMGKVYNKAKRKQQLYSKPREYVKLNVIATPDGSSDLLPGDTIRLLTRRGVKDLQIKSIIRSDSVNAAAPMILELESVFTYKPDRQVTALWADIKTGQNEADTETTTTVVESDTTSDSETHTIDVTTSQPVVDVSAVITEIWEPDPGNPYEPDDEPSGTWFPVDNEGSGSGSGITVNLIRASVGGGNKFSVSYQRGRTSAPGDYKVRIQCSVTNKAAALGTAKATDAVELESDDGVIITDGQVLVYDM